MHRDGKKALMKLIPLDMLPIEYGGQGLSVTLLTGKLIFPIVITR